jgi:hypothetical protein
VKVIYVGGSQVGSLDLERVCGPSHDIIFFFQYDLIIFARSRIDWTTIGFFLLLVLAHLAQMATVIQNSGGFVSCQSRTVWVST